MYTIRINGIEIDTDAKTAIGITFQAYDVNEPARPKFTVSNTFTIPKTAKNLRAIGFAGNVYFYSTLVYESLEVDVIFKNVQLVRKAKARINAITDRIELVIYSKDDAFDKMKKTKFNLDEALELFNYIRNRMLLPTINNKAPTLNSFIAYFINNYNWLVTPFCFTNLFDDDLTKSFEGFDYITLSDGEKKGAHFAIYVKDFFEFIAQRFWLDFSNDENFPGNIFNDEVFKKLVIFIPHFVVRYDSGYYIDVAGEEENYGQQKLNFEASYLDLFMAVVKYLNILVLQDNLNYGKYRLIRFDELPNIAEIKSLDKNIIKIEKFQPLLDNLGQLNYIKFSKVDKKSDKYYNAKTFECKNKTLDATKDFVEVPAYAFNFYHSTVSGKYIPNLTDDKLNNITVMYIDTNNKAQCNVFYDSNYSQVELFVPKLYSLESEYTFLSSILEYPKVFEITKILSIEEIVNFNFSDFYYSTLLNGLFFVNKIQGFNPLQPEKGAKMQLIFVGVKTPNVEVETFYFVDGLGNIFVDGLSNNFISN